VYYLLPGTLRAVLYFCYRYFVRLGILDGRAGFYFAFFQALWFRMLVDAKVFERSMQESQRRRDSLNTAGKNGLGESRGRGI